MEIKYNLESYSQEEAYQKIDSFLDSLVSQYSDMISNPTKVWNEEKDKMDFGFKAKGFNIMGNINILEDKLVLNGNIPFLAIAFSGKIEEIINKNLDELFVKKK